MRIVVFTEDTSKQAQATWQHLVRRLATAVATAEGFACDTSKVAAEPAAAEPAKVMAGNGWRNRPSDRGTIALMREIAGRLRSRPDRFVFFHADGDVPWSKRPESTTPADYSTQVERAVSYYLRDARNGPPTPGRRRAPPPPVTPEVEAELSRELAKLRLVSPYYTLEAWLLQSADKGKERCTAKPCGAHVARFDAWSADRGALDEVVKPADQVCFGKGQNAALAGALSNAVVQEVVAAGKSLAATVDHLRTSAPFVAALRATIPGQDAAPPPA